MREPVARLLEATYPSVRLIAERNMLNRNLMDDMSEFEILPFHDWRVVCASGKVGNAERGGVLFDDASSLFLHEWHHHADLCTPDAAVNLSDAVGQVYRRQRRRVNRHFAVDCVGESRSPGSE